MTKIKKKRLSLLPKLGFQVESAGTEIDLVCGMEVDHSKAEFRAKRHGKKYYFCSKHCLDHFKMDPEKYIG